MPQTTKKKIDKKAIVASLTEKIENAHAVVFAKYQGMTNLQLEELKKSLKKLNAELVVAKNRLMLIALDEKKLKPEDRTLEQATITLFAYDDPVSPLKELTKMHNVINLPVITFGIVEKQLLADTDLLRLSNLPSRDVLLTQVVGSMMSPLYGLHRALSWHVHMFVLTLKAIEMKKSA